MLPPEIMQQIRRLEIRTNRVVDELVGGAYHSVFKGRGIEFDEVREYTTDDDVRDIDWNVSARMGTPFVKKYIEERELNVLLIVDVSASGEFGSRAKSKRQTAAELAAMLAFSAGANHDKVGMLGFSDRIEEYLPPKSGRRHALRLVREILALEPRGKGTNLTLALNEAYRLLNKRSVVFIISDFEVDGEFRKALRVLSSRHDTIALRLLDAAEREWPLALPVTLEDAETGSEFELSGGVKFRQRTREYAQMRQNQVAEVCRNDQVDLVELTAGEDTLRPIIEFFERRQRRRVH